ncbi:50S ribosomal protein L1 [Buchnera aphidicola]|uniref:Large ribosomal subunit protein uL1 n=1 Tax=Buchnera aphidicola (Stegophylla sp.) TaxID=2315800 RepID=A0A4D6YDZ0_9GAMM|nr:50S ribosomal protein L1 [Buchnera aphidicola (Stegophylla sp.)]QCI26233.1 50S ribosomal protein L1 [Buchnera aphidicola (Stegophylla sp.)]
MIKIKKKIRNIKDKIDFKKKYNVYNAIDLLKKFSTKNFIESFDVAINLGIDAKKSNQNIRGFVILPHGLGRKVKIAVCTQGDNIQKAKNHGADIVGGHELIDYFKNNKINFDIVIATPDSMNIIGKLGPILGPKGLMPHLQTGTITNNIVEAIKNAKKGQIHYKNDKNGIIHTTIGKINFSNQQIQENLMQLLHSLYKLKPMQSKGIFFKKITLSTTMGIGLSIQLDNINEIKK